MAEQKIPWISGVLDRISKRLEEMSSGERAVLRRMRREGTTEAAGVLIPLLYRAGIGHEVLGNSEELRRWARIVQVMALLSGTQGRAVQAPGRTDEGKVIAARDLGQALREADWSETRMMRLASARGPALAGLLTPMARYLAGKARLPLDLSPLAELVRWDGRDGKRAEAARLKLATGYFARVADETSSEPEDTE
ncbi:MAG: type I-E CRISPR-associated protein Cse2/CasB [Tropicimonas sp.]|uniref:type I-E CRISPR-associated protein Cse2/CasB n=1 Tax=Tropicimonas sp. TaxID=2067044 RepID=UPI003A886F7D